MSLIKPFKGIRPQKKFVKEISFPNINYINNYKKNKKLNFLNILNNKSVYKAKQMLLKLEEKKIINEDNSDHFYLYKITNKKKYYLVLWEKLILKTMMTKKFWDMKKLFLKE